MLSLEELKNIKPGQWLFTCSMKPLQFGSFSKEKNPDDYNRAAFTDEKWEQFSKYDDFVTEEGSWHSTKSCGLHPISETYAKWFTENKCWEIFDRVTEELKDKEETEFNNRWVLYENEVKALCKEQNIEYEGI